MNKPDRTHFEALFQRILSGELTRAEAAVLAHEQTGSNPGTFLGWLRTSGHAASLKDLRLSAGDNHRNSHAKNRPGVARAYEEAVAEALRGKQSVRKVAIEFSKRGVSYPWLLKRVKKKLQSAEGSVMQETVRKLEEALAQGAPS